MYIYDTMGSRQSVEEQIDDLIWDIEDKVKDIEAQARKSKNNHRTYLKKAKKAIKEGEIKDATVLVKHSIQENRFSLRMHDMALTMTSMISNLKQAQIMGDFSKTLADLSSVFSNMVTNTDVIERMDNIENDVGDVMMQISTVQRSLKNIGETAGMDLSIDEEIDDQEVISIIAQLRDENDTAYLSKIPLPPNANFEDHIKSELEKLKNDHKK